ncbi:hypothetical protein [Petroclostridium sp. X23]|nr:hypothetical protein [Petroclostridium sp. X23]WHH59153.1 hypothetical protein QKW49_25765 [Petroclostridium sp. X23]
MKYWIERFQLWWKYKQLPNTFKYRHMKKVEIARLNGRYGIVGMG